MKKVKLNYRFHNPNTVETTADYIAKIFVESNRRKVESLLSHHQTVQKESIQKEDPALVHTPDKEVI